MKKILLGIVGLLFSATLFSQSVGIGNSDFTPDSSAALEIRSNNKGLLIPRMSFSERNAILLPSKGLLLYQNDQTSGFYYYNGTKWELLGSNYSDKDTDPTNEIQVLSIINDEIFLSNGGGSVILPAGTIGAQKLSFKGTSLSIDNGNTIDLAPLKDNMGDHKATKNIVLFSHFLSGDGGDEGISIASNGNVLLSNDLTVTGDLNLKAGSINSADIKDGTIISDDIKDGTIVSSKIGNGQISADKLSNMGANLDDILKWNGSVWTPSALGQGLNYKGIWSAQFNTPDVNIGTKLKGDYYIVSNHGEQDLGGGKQDYEAGDWIVYNGSQWEYVDRSSGVVSVFGRKGVVTAETGDYTWNQIDKSTSSLSDLAEVSSSNPNAGDILIGDGSAWQNKALNGDISIDLNGNVTVVPKKITYDKLQDAVGTIGTILKWNGAIWEEFDINPLYTDEIQNPILNSSNVLELSGSNVSVDLSKFLDNTDSQELAISGDVLSIAGGKNIVDLSKYLDNTDNQKISLSGHVLSVTNGSSVDLSGLFLKNLQTLSLDKNLLSLTGRSNLIDLSGYLDNTDNQELELVGNKLSISRGTKEVDLSSLSNKITKVFGRIGDITAQNNDYTWDQVDKSVSSINDIADVNSVDLTKGNILIADGLKWNSQIVSGDVSLNENGLFAVKNGAISTSKLANNAVETNNVLNKSITYSKLQDISSPSSGISSNRVIVWNGISWVDKHIGDVEIDGSISNELQALSLSGDLLSLTQDSSPVNLSAYKDNTDEQELTLTGSVLSISGSTKTVDLGSSINTDKQQLGITGDELTLTNSSSVNLSKYTQGLSLNTGTNVLSISGGGSTVDLSDYVDDQTLKISGHELTISGALPLNIESADSQDLKLTGDDLSLSRDATTVSLSKYRQNLSLIGTNLYISNGNDINLSTLNTDKQELKLVDNNLSISGGTNIVNLLSFKDNLGNHTATKNLILGANWLSFDGTNNGLSINSSGNVTVNKELNIDGTFRAKSDALITGALSIGGPAETSAVFNITSTNKGILIPRLSASSISNIASPAKGLMVYNTDDNEFNYFNNTKWTSVGNDNLGDHEATKNISLNGFRLSNDGDKEGIQITDDGDVGISGRVFVGGRMMIGYGSLSSSALLELTSKTHGFVVPRMSTIQRNAMVGPIGGLMVYDSDTKSLMVHNGSDWYSTNNTDNNWGLKGNKTINESTDYLGCDNAADVIIKTQGAEVVRVTKDSRVSIGSPTTKVHLSAKLEVNSVNKGFLPPRMTSAERKAIISPAIGLVVFDTDKNNLYLYTGMWSELGVPIGSVQAFMGTTIPDGWLICDGNVFSKALYPILFKVIGTETLPDLLSAELKGSTNVATTVNYIIRAK